MLRQQLGRRFGVSQAVAVYALLSDVKFPVKNQQHLYLKRLTNQSINLPKKDLEQSTEQFPPSQVL